MEIDYKRELVGRRRVNYGLPGQEYANPCFFRSANDHVFGEDRSRVSGVRRRWGIWKSVGVTGDCSIRVRDDLKVLVGISNGGIGG